MSTGVFSNVGNFNYFGKQRQNSMPLTQNSVGDLNSSIFDYAKKPVNTALLNSGIWNFKKSNPVRQPDFSNFNKEIVSNQTYKQEHERKELKTKSENPFSVKHNFADLVLK